MLVSGKPDTAGAEPLAGIAIPGAVQISKTLRPCFALDLFAAEPGTPQPDATANVVADQGGIEPALDRERSADRTSLSGMQIGQPDREPHPRQLSRLLELLHGRAFDPVVRRRDEAHVFHRHQSRNAICVACAAKRSRFIYTRCQPSKRTVLWSGWRTRPRAYTSASRTMRLQDMRRAAGSDAISLSYSAGLIPVG